MRWPYVFVSGYLDGLQIFNLQDPHNPVTVGYYDTYIGPEVEGRPAMFNGAFGVDVRNEDGADRHQRHVDRLLDLQDGRLPGLER